MTEPPVPSNFKNLPEGWICKVRSSQNWEPMFKTWAPESIKVVALCPFTITGASLECPNKQAVGSGLRKGIGAASCCPVLWAALIQVGFGLGLGRECWGPTVGCCGCHQWGVGLHSLSSPQTGLKLLLEWGIPLPYGPSPGI